MHGRDREGIGRQFLMTNSGQFFGQPDLTDAAINGRLFHTCSQAASDVSTTLDEDTHTGLLLGNPKNSGKYLVMHEFGWGVSARITDDKEGVIGLATGGIGNMAKVAAPVIYPSLIGGTASSIAYADQAGVVTGTLTMAKIVSEADATAATVQSYGTTVAHVINLKGSLVISPGYLIGTDFTLATGAVLWFHFQWEEIDI